MTNELVPYENIENKIYLIRGQKVMLDRELARLYGVKTFVLNQSVKRNIKRFPEDFMFSLSQEEKTNISQIVICSERPYEMIKHAKNVNAFTEQGIAMLSSVLNSERAILINIQIMRTFSKLRQMIAGNKEFAKKLELLEKRVLKHDGDIRGLVRDIRKLSLPKPEKKMGFLR